jgi:protein SCO1/2
VTIARAGRASAAIAMLLVAGAGMAPAADDTAALRVPPPLRGIAIEDRAGALVPLDLELTDQDGARRTLGDLFEGGVPVVLVLGYFRCPMLCGVVFERLRDGFAGMKGRRLGRDFRAAAVSIEPRETAADARARRDGVLGPDAHALTSGGWPFLVASGSASRAIADAVGFRYRYDGPTEQYAHATGAFVLTPDGRVSRTLQGLDFAPATLEAALADAAAGKVTRETPVDAVLIQCFRFMPSLRRHAGAISGFLRAGAAVIVLGLFAVFAASARRRRAAGGSEPQR